VRKVGNTYFTLYKSYRLLAIELQQEIWMCRGHCSSKSANHSEELASCYS